MATLKTATAALQWLLDDMHDAGETHNSRNGKIFDCVEEAAATLVELGGVLSWYSIDNAKAYRTANPASVLDDDANDGRDVKAPVGDDNNAIVSIIRAE